MHNSSVLLAEYFRAFSCSGFKPIASGVFKLETGIGVFGDAWPRRIRAIDDDLHDRTSFIIAAAALVMRSYVIAITFNYYAGGLE